MTSQVYGIGYGGRKLHEIKRIAEELDATVFDVRLSPRSRIPYFTEAALAARLGDRYVHVGDLGNLNYRGGPVRIADLEAGIRRIADHGRPVILMCACKDPARCHRTTIAAELQARGFSYQEIDPPKPAPTQLPLF